MRIGLSTFLFALGAILTWAVTLDPTPIGGMTVEWDTVGVILMVVGVVGLIWSLVLLSAWRDRTDTATVVERDRYIDDTRVR